MTNLVELAITDIAFGGAGIGRYRGQVYFVPGTAPGEIVLAEPLAQHRTYQRARLAAIVQPSPDRCAPACPLAVRPLRRQPATSPFCAGCAFQHLTYTAEVRIKQAQLNAMLAQAGCPEAVVAPAVPAPQPLGYRNKLVLHVRGTGARYVLGYVQEDNQTVFDIPACPLAMAAINDMLAGIRARPGIGHTFREGMDVTFRATAADGVVWWRAAPDAKAPWLTETSSILGPIAVPRGSFYQVNPAMADMLMDHVAAILKSCGPAVVVDLYSGVGVFGLLAARNGIARVHGVESDQRAVQAARHNADKLGCAAAVTFTAGDALRALPEIAHAYRSESSVVIVDPPRGGLDARMRQALLAFKPQTILYVSCAADKLARDLPVFIEGGYRLAGVRLFDMFPRTAHFETLAHLQIKQPTAVTK